MQHFEHTPKNINTLNPLIIASTILLTLLIYIRNSKEKPDITVLQKKLIIEIEAFEHQLTAFKLHKKIILAARYCICAAIDEAALNTNWGATSSWAQQTLLNNFHQETWGGERFYLILETLVKLPNKHRDILEFIYLLLSLGFEGKFFTNSQQFS